MIEHFEWPTGLAPSNGYSHATAGAGRIVAVSGQLPVDSVGDLVGASDALTQARQVFVNMEAALRAAGALPDDILRLTFFLLDLADLGAVRTARDEFLAGGPPAREFSRAGCRACPPGRAPGDRRIGDRAELTSVART